MLAPLTMPVYLIPGNHEDRRALVAEFPDHSYLPRDGGFLQYVVERYPVRLVALDTIVPGKGGGLMCGERLQWLDARLREAPARPTMIFMHHPPFRTGIARMDALGLDNAEALGEVIHVWHPDAGLVTHTSYIGEFAGRVPSTTRASSSTESCACVGASALGARREPRCGRGCRSPDRDVGG
jgi:Icc protein